MEQSDTPVVAGDMWPERLKVRVQLDDVPRFGDTQCPAGEKVVPYNPVCRTPHDVMVDDVPACRQVFLLKRR
jgi:hypothetical protein